MATTTKSEETRVILDGLIEGLNTHHDVDTVTRVLELQFLREISDGLEAIQREIGFVPGPRE